MNNNDQISQQPYVLVCPQIQVIPLNSLHINYPISSQTGIFFSLKFELFVFAIVLSLAAYKRFLFVATKKKEDF